VVVAVVEDVVWVLMVDQVVVAVAQTELVDLEIPLQQPLLKDKMVETERHQEAELPLTQEVVEAVQVEQVLMDQVQKQEMEEMDLLL
jgi:hypothetical protein